jgi:TRAP-type uncharacterized transport system fused permease subunit
VLQGDLLPLLYLLPSCIIGIGLIAAGFEGYLLKVGKVKKWAQAPLVIAGFVLSFPSLTVTVVGLAAAVVLVTLLWLQNRREAGISPARAS